MDARWDDFVVRIFLTNLCISGVCISDVFLSNQNFWYKVIFITNVFGPVSSKISSVLTLAYHAHDSECSFVI